MNLPDEQKNNTNNQHPENQPQPMETAQPKPPTNEYWVGTREQNQAPTTPHGFGQGYQKTYQPTMPPPPPPMYNQGYQTGFAPPPQQQQPPQQQYKGYQYNPNSGWQQPTQARPQENYQWNFQDYDKAAEAKNKKKKNRGLVVFMVSLVCVLALGLITVSSVGVYRYINGGENIFVSDNTSSSASGNESDSSAATAQIEIASKPQIAESLPLGGKMTIPQVAKAVAPSVVGVEQYRPEQSFVATGSGSGIVMSADGYIITNSHVVRDGTAFKIILADGTPRDADLIGEDYMTDLAVLKIQGEVNLTPAVFGDSNQVQIGEQAIAIGNPGGTELAGSVTLGIVSAVNREIPTIKIPLIQTDAAINPGNSGGALVNEYGQIIGINSAKIVSTEFEGIGFAIPISVAKPIIDDIVTNGRVTGRVKLGITGDPVDEIDARNYGVQQGVRIMQIDPSSDLVNTEAQRYDIITEVDGVRVLDMIELKSELEKHKPGDTVTLTLFRLIGTTRSETLSVTITLQEDK